MMRSQLAIVMLVLMSVWGQAYAQEYARQDLPKGEVTGLEMGIEGTVHVVPGGKVRWFVTVYEIVKGRDIRPAAGVTLRALASFHPQAPVASATSDARGRATLSFEVPAKQTESFDLVVEARSSKGVKRNFDVTMKLGPRFKTEFFVERKVLPPGAQLRVWGRVMDMALGRPAAKHAVHLRAQTNHGLVGEEHRLVTDAGGVFQALLVAPKNSGAFQLVAQAKDAPLVSREAVAKVEVLPAMLIYANAKKAVVAPGTTVLVDVVVRTPDGRPVPRATLTGLSIPESKKNTGHHAQPIAPTLTDSKGRAQVQWAVKGNEDLSTVTGSIHALREGLGTAKGEVQIRVARSKAIVSWAVEGGALIPGLPSRIFVSVYHPDGRPWADVPLALSSGRLRAKGTRTGKDGTAVLEAEVGLRDTNPPASCQGPTVAAATLSFSLFTKEVCLPVDPDATLRVRHASRILAGHSLAVKWSARASVAKSPVVVTLLGKSDGRWQPLVERLIASSKHATTLMVPSNARGLLWVRARPLIGATQQPIRGGSSGVWAQAEAGSGMKFNATKTGTIKIEAQGGTAGGLSTAFALALPTQRGQALLRELRSSQGGHPDMSASDIHWMGFLASQTPTDVAVSAVLRDRRRVSLAMPEDSVGMGLLRDPWRSRSRFVRGRLGRLMLAVETYAKDNLPNSVDNVAVHTAHGWRFNSEILTVVASAMGQSAVAGLDGSPLTIAGLQAMDANFNFDNVARRITRERLLNVLVALRQFVKANHLDYEWARRGDPKTWMKAIVDWDDPDGELFLDSLDLHDGWGKPLAIRKAKGPRARFRFLEPIVGYEVLSAGPDGRFGTRDDVHDPFERVLPSKSLYARAIGEDILLARLQGVELGRATIAVLGELFDVEKPQWHASKSHVLGATWSQPEHVMSSREGLKVQAVGALHASASGFVHTTSTTSNIALDLSADPRRYMIVSGLYRSDGEAFFEATSLQAGSPLLIDARMPPRLRPGEVLEIPLQVTGLGAQQELSVQATGDAVVSVELIGKTKFALGAGESQQIGLRLLASRVGSGIIQLRFVTKDGIILRDIKHRLPVIWDGSMRAQHGAGVGKQTRLQFKVPSDAMPIRSYAVVTAPTQLLRDPGFQVVQERTPEILAWAYVLRGDAMPPSLLTALSRPAAVHRSMPALLVACRAMAWSAQTDDDQATLATRSIDALRRTKTPSSMRERSALLIALAGSASTAKGSKSAAQDPVAMLVRQLRNDGWHAPQTEKAHPTVMARLAAGLLLVNRNDMPGRSMYELARASLVPAAGGGKEFPVEAGQSVDAWIGSLALAIAARQLGDDALADQLVHALAPRLYLGMQGDAEPAFWLLAASAYGVFGVEGPRSVTAKIDDKSVPISFVKGRAIIKLPSQRAKLTLGSATPVIARIEARYMRPIIRRSDSELIASLDGDVGHAGDIATLELKVKNLGSESQRRPRVEVMLPSAAVLSQSALASLRRAPGVVKVEAPDNSGLLRIHLAALKKEEERRLPLAVQWVGKGNVSGLSVSIYDAASPWNISSTPSQSLELTLAPEETWK